MTDDDKQFVEERERTWNCYPHSDHARLCLIIRRLEAECRAFAEETEKYRSEWLSDKKRIAELEAKSEQRTNLSAVALTVHESTARELAALRAEIENAPVVRYPSLDDDWCEGPFTEDYPWEKSAKLLRIKNWEGK